MIDVVAGIIAIGVGIIFVSLNLLRSDHDFDYSENRLMYRVYRGHIPSPRFIRITSLLFSMAIIAGGAGWIISST